MADSENRKNRYTSGNFSQNKKMKNDVPMKPTVLFLWVWNWFSTIPQAVTHIYSDIKNGEFLARFTFLDAMLQFIVAIATSCHPQEDPYEKHEEESKPRKADGNHLGTKLCDGVDVYGGPGRTLRSRTVEAN